MQYSPTSQHSLTHFLPNTLQHTLFCHLVLLAVAERLHNLGSGASKTLARWIVMNFLTFVSSGVFFFSFFFFFYVHTFYVLIFFQRSACRQSFCYDTGTLNFLLFFYFFNGRRKTPRTSSSTKVTFHHRFFFFFFPFLSIKTQPTLLTSYQKCNRAVWTPGVRVHGSSISRSI